MRYIAVALVLAGCSSSSGGVTQPPGDDAAPDAPQGAQEAGREASSDARTPEAGGDAGPADGQPGTDDGGPVDAPRGDAIPIGSDGATCTGNAPGDGGTYCTLYAFQVDGAPLDEAGNPRGITVVEACTPGAACTACIGGYSFAGLCE